MKRAFLAGLVVGAVLAVVALAKLVEPGGLWNR